MSPRSFLITLMSLAAMTSFGCTDAGQGAADKKPTFKVSGTITMAGGPVVNAAVIFSGKENQPPAMGRTDSAGKYTLTTYDEPGDGAVAGLYAVTVTKASVAASGQSDEQVHQAYSSGGAPTGSHTGPAGDSSSESTDLLPEKYKSSKSTPLEAKVEEKDNVIDFKLEP